MFADACRKASEYSRPVVISTRQQNGDVNSSVATFIVLNREGWILTAAHIYDSFVKFQSDLKKAKEIEEINSSRVQQPGAPSSAMKLDPTMLTNHSFWWGWDGVRIRNEMVNRQLDIAVGKLEPFDPSWVKEYPVIGSPSDVKPGRSICRSGFALVEFKAQWDERNKAFMIPKLNSKDLVFHNDGMITRVVNQGKCNNGDYERVYVETSTPGVKGQSGGPIYDVEGKILGLQVSTAHISLGFHPTVEYKGSTVVENQFMNLGLGIHVKEVRKFLDEQGVRYDTGAEDGGFRIVG